MSHTNVKFDLPTTPYAERRAERKEQMKKLTEGTFTVSATGTDVKSVTQNIIAATSGISLPTGSSFDIKA